MSDRDVQIGARNFKLNKMDVFKQFHVVRKLAPLLSELIPVAGKLQGLSETEISKNTDALKPLVDAFSSLSDVDSEYVLLNLLSCVEMQQTTQGGWSRVSNGAVLLFQDLELPELLQLAVRAFMYNLKGFFGVLPSVSGAKV